MPAEFVLEVKRFDPKDRRLGRHVVHDSRSKRFAAKAVDPRKLASVRHVINLPILDQGSLGACTGYAGTATLASDAFWEASHDELLKDPNAFAVGLYSAATKIDPWPGTYEPDDTGSDGLSIAKTLHTRGLIAGYQHALTLDAALSALAKNVVMIGSSWYEGMYNVSGDGRMSVNGPSLGGHEYVLDELDVERRRVWMRNSWSDQWGLKGRAWMLWGELGKLLADDGDCTILVPRDKPAPVPEPLPAPAPPEVLPLDNGPLAVALTKYLRTASVPKYVRNPATTWLKGVKS